MHGSVLRLADEHQQHFTSTNYKPERVPSCAHFLQGLPYMPDELRF